MPNIEMRRDDSRYVSCTLTFDLVYADVIYQNTDFSWITRWWNDFLKINGIFIVQTDQSTVAEWKIFLDSLSDANFVNWCIYINDWGGTPKKGFPKKHDDILIYSKGEDFYWDKREIEIPKVTAGTKFDKKGTGMKTPCDVFYDHASFSTMSKERVKTEDNHNIQWQKPLWLISRLILPFTKEGANIGDPFMGSGTVPVWCGMNNRNYFGTEIDDKVYSLAVNRYHDWEISTVVEDEKEYDFLNL